MKNNPSELSNNLEELVQANGLTQSQINDYLYDLVRGKSDGTFLYEWYYANDEKNSGAYLFEEAVNTPEYREFFKQEEELFEKNKDVLRKYIGKKGILNHTELGPSDGRKFVKYMKKLPDREKIFQYKIYRPADVSERARRVAGAYVSKELQMVSDPIDGDWRESQNLKNDNRKINYMFGWSLAAFESRGCIEILRNIRSDADLQGRDFIFSYFVPPQAQEEIKKLIKAYYTDKVKNRIMRGLEELGLDISKLEFEVMYTDSRRDEMNILPPRISVGARVKEGEQLTIKSKNSTWTYNGGHFFCAIPSIRRSEAEILRIATEAGYKNMESFMGQDMWLMVLRSRPKLQETLRYKHRSRTKAVLYALLWLSTYATWDNLYSTYKDQNKINEKIELAIKYKDLSVTTNGYPSHANYTLEEKMKRVDELADMLYSTLKIRYKNYSFPSQRQLKNAIKLLLVKDNNLELFTQAATEKENLVYFIDNIFRPNFTTFSVETKSLEPYEHFKKYERLMNKTLKDTTNATLDSKKTLYYDYWVIKASVNKYTQQKVNEIGLYMTAEGEIYELISVTINSYPGDKSEPKFIMAKPVWFDAKGEIEQDGVYSVLDGKKVIRDYFKKWYVSGVADKIMDNIYDLYQSKKESPANDYDSYARMMAGKTPTARDRDLVEDILIQHIITWYNLSYLLDEGNEEMLKHFISEYLPEYIREMMPDKQELLSKYNFGRLWKLEKPALYSVLKTFWEFVDKYYFSDADKQHQDVQWLKNELLQELLSQNEIDYEYLLTEEGTFNYLYQRKEICWKYWYTLNTWEDMPNFESWFIHDLTSEWIKEVLETTRPNIPGLNYFHNFYRTRNGKIFSVIAQQPYAYAVEINDITNHNAVEARKDEFREIVKNQKPYLAKLDKKAWGTPWDSMGKRNATKAYINDNIIPFRLSAGREVAKDYMIQKYVLPLSYAINKQLLAKYSCRDSSRDYDLKHVEEIVIEQLFEEVMSTKYYDEESKKYSILTSLEKWDVTLRDVFIDTYLLPKCAGKLENYLDLEEYNSKSITQIIQSDYVNVRENVIWIMNFIGSTNKEFDQLTDEQLWKVNNQELGWDKLSQIILYFIQHCEWLDQEMTQEDRYKYLMEHGEVFHQQGFEYLDLSRIRERPVSLRNCMRNTITYPSNEKRPVGWFYHYDYQQIYITPEGEKFEVAANRDMPYFIARPIATQEEREKELHDRLQHMTSPYLLPSEEAPRLKKLIDEKYDVYQVKHAAKIFKEIQEFFGEDIYFETEMDRLEAREKIVSGANMPP